ncbi:alpha-1,4-glucan--maltose-1-phosphate maltosyltransferase [Methylovorus glucosotrophus]|uniref:Alpha-1,4-glucan:maltose-1-phosphate maltosyltransferase n=1 Tax=Methylovorus glucosotrophus (strain SIP3-4) TaxID=582744 RepID=C6XB30_METGS|nr:alpha-1,4-glucan--maltose-1-phosphate maltosyltransferase [Methylovorus glucosotrophus]ACT51800.1 alpha amylase catalytic region [Methylovorus glucosotrophus SIP3-4]
MMLPEDLDHTPDPLQQSKEAAVLEYRFAILHRSRIAIENVTPCVDGGRFAVKRQQQEAVVVSADVFMDTHDLLRVCLAWHSGEDGRAHYIAMQSLGNDRWQASFVPPDIGCHYFFIEAWHDEFGTYVSNLRKKAQARLQVELEIEEGRLLIAKYLAHSNGGPADHRNALNAKEFLARLVCALESPEITAACAMQAELQQVDSSGLDLSSYSGRDQVKLSLLLSGDVAHMMETLDPRNFMARSIKFPLMVERTAAAFASWYEMFPRSQSGDTERHGTLQDVVARLPAIRDMGFDVLYFPPIHPIGLTHRKGRNNALIAQPSDPGSPYAIGSHEGGHEALHPQLGTWEDWDHLLEQTRLHGMEIALDFAIQCSPDHPWISQHPEWFDWRPDGSLRHAENPPKKYEDIVNVAFYAPEAIPHLWLALRNILLHWIAKGVKIFRVDNPHTKPLPFWEWLLRTVREQHPDVVFLSEAFTTPKMMYRLAKTGFSQSYTYFTWRNDKQGLTDYLQEMAQGEIADFFRPNFFVNTPDINPVFLQESGRPGFLIRAALAATLSGLWGISSGFELCEADAVPDSEEFNHSEKYEIRAWDWQRPGNIVAEISRLNQIRRENPQLQTHLGVRFHPSSNDQVLFFSKTGQRDVTRPSATVVLVAINLDPHATQSATLQIPLYLLGLVDDADVDVLDLWENQPTRWQGKFQTITLDPADRPFAIWRLDAGNR